MTRILLSILPQELSIHRLPPSRSLPQVLQNLPGSSGTATEGSGPELFATLHSDNELSIVCDAALVVEAEQSSGPWRALRVAGQLDFALTGILAGLAAPLAEAKISIFAISSFDTDYLLVKSESLNAAVTTLEQAGYQFEQHL